MSKQALVVWGGWDGHTPKQSVDRFIPFLEQNGFAVTVSNDLASYADAALMAQQDLIVQCVTMSRINGEQFKGLNEAVRGGCGLAGWHGGLCDSFREHPEYQWMTGGQWVAHPGNCMAYGVHIANPHDGVTAGLADFTMPNTEQYYLHVDPANVVLATTRFSGERAAEIREVSCRWCGRRPGARVGCSTTPWATPSPTSTCRSAGRSPNGVCFGPPAEPDHRTRNNHA